MAVQAPELQAAARRTSLAARIDSSRSGRTDWRAMCSACGAGGRRSRFRASPTPPGNAGWIAFRPPRTLRFPAPRQHHSRASGCARRAFGSGRKRSRSMWKGRASGCGEAAGGEGVVRTSAQTTAVLGLAALVAPFVKAWTLAAAAQRLAPASPRDLFSTMWNVLSLTRAASCPSGADRLCPVHRRLQ